MSTNLISVSVASLCKTSYIKVGAENLTENLVCYLHNSNIKLIIKLLAANLLLKIFIGQYTYCSCASYAAFHFNCLTRDVIE